RRQVVHRAVHEVIILIERCRGGIHRRRKPATSLRLRCVTPHQPEIVRNPIIFNILAHRIPRIAEIQTPVVLVSLYIPRVCVKGMPALSVDIARQGKLDVITYIEEVTASAEVETPAAFFSITRHNNPRFTFPLGGEHSKQESGRKRNLIELYIERSGNNLVVGNGFASCGNNREVWMLQVTSRKPVVDA